MIITGVLVRIIAAAAGAAIARAISKRMSSSGHDNHRMPERPFGFHRSYATARAPSPVRRPQPPSSELNFAGSEDNQKDEAGAGAEIIIRNQSTGEPVISEYDNSNHLSSISPVRRSQPPSSELNFAGSEDNQKDEAGAIAGAEIIVRNESTGEPVISECYNLNHLNSNIRDMLVENALSLKSGLEMAKEERLQLSLKGEKAEVKYENLIEEIKHLMNKCGIKPYQIQEVDEEKENEVASKLEELRRTTGEPCQTFLGRLGIPEVGTLVKIGVGAAAVATLVWGVYKLMSFYGGARIVWSCYKFMSSSGGDEYIKLNFDGSESNQTFKAGAGFVIGNQSTGKQVISALFNLDHLYSDTCDIFVATAKGLKLGLERALKEGIKLSCIQGNRPDLIKWVKGEDSKIPQAYMTLIKEIQNLMKECGIMPYQIQLVDGKTGNNIASELARLGRVKGV